MKFCVLFKARVCWWVLTVRRNAALSSAGNNAIISPLTFMQSKQISLFVQIFLLLQLLTCQHHPIPFCRIGLELRSCFYCYLVENKLNSPCSDSSLFAVLQRGVRHLRLLWQEVYEHADLLLWSPPHLLRHTQLPHRLRRAVCHPDAPSFEGCRPESPVSLQVGQVCLPLWHRQR